jgi:catechol 2,3-dioxygenase-like lactoylglutathione lyase family enzyme
METMTSFYPVVMTADVEEAAAFFVRHFGFETTFSAEWYASLRRGDAELAFLDPAHETIPAGFGRVASGLLLNYEVDDARGAYDRLVLAAGLRVALDLRDEDFGQRHFIVVAPGNVLVDVIQNIPPADAYAGAYTQETAADASLGSSSAGGASVSA